MKPKSNNHKARATGPWAPVNDGLLRGSERSEMRHGIDCEKVMHNEKGGYMHAAGDNSPYEIDGLTYCGRCHYEIPTDS